MAYKNEQQIEENLIEGLVNLKYRYREDIRDRNGLVENFRQKFNSLNKVNLTDPEFNRLYEQIVGGDVFTNAKRLRQKNYFEREDGTPLTYTLVNIKDWCKNTFEVVRQLRINTLNSHHRYDVILLINGIPVVQIELKNLDVSPHRAMHQIINYKNDPGNGYTNSLLCFMQLFIVSNQSSTWYFANNDKKHFSFDADERFLPYYRFADKDNKKIDGLDKFTRQFLAKCRLGEMISKYMVLVESEQKLMMMRPYQIYAVEAIIDCIHQNRGNGYIWHTTGSGKTLTSFKASTILKTNPDIEKCLFVVDRKDLDRQTREEFNKFQENCVEENTNTGTLVKRLLSTGYSDKVIVTTIQKLGLALDDAKKPKGKGKGRNKKNYRELLLPLRGKRVVFIFDECHRSQFGDNHKAIREFFPNAQLFGFTGTPIFAENSTYTQISGEVASYKTTEEIFHKCLHYYTITNAIEDNNVLRFHIDYFKSEGSNCPKAGDMMSSQAVIDTILEKHNSATAGRKFNAVLTTSSIDHAIEYYNLFKEIQKTKQAEDESFKSLNVACVFSPPAGGNKDAKQMQEDLPQERADNKVEPEKKKKALRAIITDYNKMYGTNHSINSFDLYYQDIQGRIKNQKYSNSDLPHSQKIDIVIVVDMLLTGFDSKYLNTLYVDKNLKYHGLIQAFSRTNRILNDSKPYGNILDFRTQKYAVDKAIERFSGADKERSKEIWLVESAPKVIDKLKEAVTNLKVFMKSQGLECAPDQVANLKGDDARAKFITNFKEIQRIKTQLDQYTDLTVEDDLKISGIIPEDQLRAFRGVYLDTARRLKKQQEKNEDDTVPEIQKLDFEFVLFASSIVDYDYIMNLIARFSDETVPEKQRMTREELIGLLSSNSNFMDQRDDMIAYINTLKAGEGLSVEAIREGFELFKEEKFKDQIDEISNKYNLKSQDLETFVNIVMRRMILDTDMLSELFESQDLGWKERAKKENSLMENLIPLLKKLAQGREISGLNAYEE